MVSIHIKIGVNDSCYASNNIYGNNNNGSKTNTIMIINKLEIYK